MAVTSIYEAIGRNLGDVLLKGVPTNCTGTTLDCKSLVYPLTNQLEGHEIYIYEGTGVDQSHIISSFDPANNRVTVDPPWTTVPTASSKFLVFERFRTEDYENAMNRMMGVARLKNLVEKVATMTLVGTQYEYPVPSGFEYVSNLRLVPSGWTNYSADDLSNRITELPTRYFSVEPNAVGTYMIVMDPRMIYLDDYNNHCVNVVGQAKPDFGATAIPEDLQEYIIAGASALLASQKISDKSNDAWRVKFGAFNSLKKEIEPYINSTRYGKRVGG